MDRRTVFLAQDLGVPGVDMFGRYRYVAARPGLAAHRHPGALEICYLAKGRQCYRVGPTLFHLKGGDQFVTFPDESHDSAGLPEERGTLFWLIVRLRPVPARFLLLERNAAQTLARSLCCLPRRHFRAPSGTAGLLDAVIQHLQGSPDPLRPLRVAHLLTRFLLQTVEAAHRDSPARLSPAIRRAVQRVRDAPNEWLRVSDLAEAAGLSEAYLKEKFRAELGLPPGEFILREKIAAAQHLLATQSVTQTAMDLGFASSQYFATAFRRFTLLTPSAFQRAIRPR